MIEVYTEDGNNLIVVINHIVALSDTNKTLFLVSKAPIKLSEDSYQKVKNTLVAKLTTNT